MADRPIEEIDSKVAIARGKRVSDPDLELCIICCLLVDCVKASILSFCLLNFILVYAWPTFFYTKIAVTSYNFAINAAFSF